MLNEEVSQDSLPEFHLSLYLALIIYFIFYGEEKYSIIYYFSDLNLPIFISWALICILQVKNTPKFSEKCSYYEFIDLSVSEQNK